MQVITGFLKLIDYPPDHFKCCENPQVVCIDGIVLSADRRTVRTRDLKSPWLLGVWGANRRFSTRRSRSLWPLDAEFKDLIKSYVNSQMGISEQDLIVLEEQATLSNSKCITNFFRVCSERPDSFHYKCPKPLRSFFECIYKLIAPTSAILPCTVWDTAAAIIQRSDVSEEDVGQFNNYAPASSGLIIFIAAATGPHKECGLVLLKYLLQKSMDCFRTSGQGESPIIDHVNDSTTNARQEVAETGVYFPGKPVIRSIYKISFEKEKEGSCNKEYYPGTLLFWCAEHKKCLGFYILTSPESLFQVYSIIVTRFPQAPSVIIYDNGCNLDDYIMNRSPQHFANTIIISDGFHWCNHKNCGCMYNSNLYISLRNINSVLHEQKNSCLDKLKPISIHMRYDSFYELLIYTLVSINSREL
jgi:hypothetical protein